MHGDESRPCHGGEDDAPRVGHEKHGEQTHARHAQHLFAIRHRPLANLERLRADEVHVGPRGADGGQDEQGHGVVEDEGGEDGGGEQDVVDLEVVQVFLHAPSCLLFFIHSGERE